MAFYISASIPPGYMMSTFTIMVTDPTALAEEWRDSRMGGGLGGLVGGGGLIGSSSTYVVLFLHRLKAGLIFL